MANRVVAWGVIVLLTALYVYSVVIGVTNVQGMVQQATLYDLDITVLGWVFMIAHLVLPVVLLILAWWLSRRRTSWNRVLLITTGLALNAALQLVLTDFETRVLTWQSFFG